MADCDDPPPTHKLHATKNQHCNSDRVSLWKAAPAYKNVISNYSVFQWKQKSPDLYPQTLMELSRSILAQIQFMIYLLCTQKREWLHKCLWRKS